MNNRFDFNGKIDFNDIDLTSPKKVIEGIIKDLNKATNDIIVGKVDEYIGPIHSYTDGGFNAIKIALGNASRKVDIQDKLGVVGGTSEQYEFYLKSQLYEHYKFRVCFIKFGVGNYPVEIVLEQGIVDEIFGEGENYIIMCNNKEEFEELITDIINSERVIKIMQELVRIHQVYLSEYRKKQIENEAKEEHNKKRPTENGVNNWKSEKGHEEVKYEKNIR